MRSGFRFWSAVAALVLLLVVVWLDVATQVWRDLTVLAGVISGLVTFALTVLVIERVLAHSTHTRWAPVTRVALGDLLKTLIEESSELMHGVVIPRRLPALTGPSASTPEDRAAVVAIGQEVARERALLAQALASWSAYLAATAEVTDTLSDVAELVDQLDGIHDTCVELIEVLTPSDRGARDEERRVAGDADVDAGVAEQLAARLGAETAAYDAMLAALVDRLVHAVRVTFRPAPTAGAAAAATAPA